jgi:hypothetical protein
MNTNTLPAPPKDARRATTGAVRIGCLVGTTATGEPLVDYPGNPDGPLVARALESADVRRPLAERTAAEVLLMFEEEDALRPVVIGVVQASGAEQSLAAGMLRRDSRDTVTVDGRVLALNGRERIVLTCGKSSITLSADGQVIIKGTRLLSRASESNKIKGATVALN